MIAKQEGLFPEENGIRYGERRKHQSLFLPNLLEKEAYSYRLDEEQQETAYKIIVRWIELDVSGKLEKKKETALEAEFLTEIFGKALGYTCFSENKEQWNIEPKLSTNGGEADAALGDFTANQKHNPQVIIELKGPKTNLDRDRFNGRTPIQQCWDYLNDKPDCPWGIVSNFVSFRLYHRNKTPRVYQLFVLQDLLKREKFREFYYLLSKGGLFPERKERRARAELLLERTGEQQLKIGADLYKHYSDNRLRLINHLTKKPHEKSLEHAIRIAQKIIDRIIFVAFCEDRGLLPENSIHDAFSKLPPFDQVTNPRWRNFLDLFKSIDTGNEKRRIPPYNGGLFRPDEEVDNLDLDDSWTNFFDSVGKYDFRHAINVDVLGHLFEKSVNDLENIRNKGVFELESDAEDQPKMKKSAERKRSGIFYTPDEFTSFITENVVGKLIIKRFAELAKKLGVKTKELTNCEPGPKMAKYWSNCLDTLRNIKIVDPACGSGAFLIKAYDLLETKYNDVIGNILFHEDREDRKLLDQVSEYILRDNLYGVDLSEASVEITQLALWIRSAQEGKSLADLSKNIVCGNSLIHDNSVDPLGIKWEEKFTEVFIRDANGFDCVIGNPPWERIKLQEREFFDLVDTGIASAVNAATRRKLIEKLDEANPKLHQRYLAAKISAEMTLDYIRKSGEYPLTGKGDINTYAVFAELAQKIVGSEGTVGLLVPSGIATDHTTRLFFSHIIDNKLLINLYDFENKAPVFQDVHRSFKFCIFIFGGKENKHNTSEFVFFARVISDIFDKKNKITLSSKDFKLLNPNTLTCPIFRSNRDAEITKSVYSRIPVLINKNRKEGGNAWGIKFLRMFDQTNDAELFKTVDELKVEKYKRKGPIWVKGKMEYLPLYEAKMIQMYDHRAASVVVKDTNWFRQGQTRETLIVEYKNPQFVSEPRWWASKDKIFENIGTYRPPALLAFKNVTSPTNQRTMIAAFIPFTGVINSAPLILFEDQISSSLQSCFLANLNSFILDYISRQKIGNVNLNFFIIEQFPMLSPDFYSDRCPWNRRQTFEKWVSDRVLKLSCTSNDMIPLAESAGFDPPVYKWKPEERTNLMAELDAAYFLMYGIASDDMEYILSTFSGVEKERDGLFDVTSTYDLILKHYDLFKNKIKS